MIGKKISLIIPTYNKAAYLDLTLESIKFQTFSKHLFEVIVIDDGSTDHTREIVAEYQKCYCIHYKKQKNDGRSAARNAGLNLAQTPLVIFIDDDLLLSPEFIECHYYSHNGYTPHISHGRIYEMPFLKFFSDPTKGIIDYPVNSDVSVLNRYLINKRDIGRLQGIVEHQKRISFFESIIEQVLNRTIEHPCLSKLDFLGCVGANTSGPKEIFLQAGGFNRQLGQLWGCEDVELGYRIQRMGISFAYLEHAVNYHMTHLRKNYEDQLFKAYNEFYVIHQNPILRELPRLLLGKEKDLYRFCDEISTLAFC